MNLTPAAVARIGKHRALIVATANRFGVPPWVALATAWKESGFDETADAGDGDGKGLFQLLPQTSLNLGWNPASESLFSPHVSARLGVLLLKELIGRFPNERWDWIYSAYRAGRIRKDAAGNLLAKDEQYLPGWRSAATYFFGGPGWSDLRTFQQPRASESPARGQSPPVSQSSLTGGQGVNNGQPHKPIRGESGTGKAVAGVGRVDDGRRKTRADVDGSDDQRVRNHFDGGKLHHPSENPPRGAGGARVKRKKRFFQRLRMGLKLALMADDAAFQILDVEQRLLEGVRSGHGMAVSPRECERALNLGRRLFDVARKFAAWS